METHYPAVPEVPLASSPSSGGANSVLQRAVDQVRRIADWVVADLLGIEGASSQEGTGGETHVSSCDTAECPDCGVDHPVSRGADLHEKSS